MNKNRVLRIATRKSALALWQANTVKNLLEADGHTVELNLVTTTGDKMQKGALASVALDDPALPDHLKTGKGLFVKEVQEEILSGKADLAVHSMKDLPVERTEGLRVAAVLPRAQASDAMIFSPALLSELAARWGSGALSTQDLTRLLEILNEIDWQKWPAIGTTSARRQTFLRHSIPNCASRLSVLRGNVDTRLQRVANNEFAFIMLARAGLDRLGFYRPDAMVTLPATLSTPAPAQGIVAIECRNDDTPLLAALSSLNSAQASLQAAFERTLLWLTGGSCHTALAAHLDGSRLSAWAAHAEQRRELQFTLTPQQLDNWDQQSRVADHSALFDALMESPLAQELHHALLDGGFDALMPLRRPSEKLHRK
ncbi:MAG: hypothetical protein RIR26_627 [Pseudomonadota bacterium]|jgi:hydroxymethylbilane synthase